MNLKEDRMANKHAMIAHGLSTKFLPLYFMVIVFLYVSDFTRDSFAIIDPTDFWISSTLIFGGLIFMYEGFNNKPKRNSTIGSAGFFFFFIIAGINFIFGGAVFLNYYDPLTDSGDINLILQGVIMANILMFLIQGIYEIILSKRFVVERAFN